MPQYVTKKVTNKHSKADSAPPILGDSHRVIHPAPRINTPEKCLFFGDLPFHQRVTGFSGSSPQLLIMVAPLC